MDDNTASKIRHSQTNFGKGVARGGGPAPQSPPAAAPASAIPEPEAAQALAPPPGAPATDVKKEIRSFGGSTKRHAEQWSRTPNATGEGAIHVRSFHCKLSEDSLLYMDAQINEWLDAHPEYEVKFVNSGIGMFVGKIKEEHLIVQVWV